MDHLYGNLAVRAIQEFGYSHWLTPHILILPIDLLKEL